LNLDQLALQQYTVDKLQRGLDDLREEWQATISFQKHEQIAGLHQALVEAEEELVNLEHTGRNTCLRLAKQSKRLKEKSTTINSMVYHQDRVRYVLQLIL
jgi:hypothetical protein